VLRALLLACIYAVVGNLGLRMDAVAGFATLVWPPTGIALAALSLLGLELWPGVALGAFVVNVWTGATVPVALGICVGNTLEAVVGAYVLRRLGGSHGPLERLSHVLCLIGPTALGSSTISATIGVLSLHAGGIIESRSLGQTWRAWWVGDVLGDLTVGAVLLTWVGARITRPPWPRIVEAGAVGASTIAVGAAVFFSKQGAASDAFLQACLLLPLLMWAALRFALRGATAMTFVVSAIAIAGTARGCGPFVQERLAKSLLSLQGFMGFAAAMALTFGAVVNELAKAIRARDRVLAIVSHDLKNPLHTIRIATAVLKRVGTRSDLVSPVDRAVDRMEYLIRDLLDLAAMGAGTVSLRVSAQDARALVEEAVEMTRALAADRVQALRVVVEGPNVSVSCDRERILQVFSNLIGNAIKFTPAGGTITIGMARDGARTTRFRVSDTGAGIDPADLPHIFERFQRGREGPHRGTGLGLSIAKAIVVAHGGKIWVESRPGHGSTFFFTLPVQPSDSEHPAESPDAGHATSSP
jgi:signal transduction histidine kinase